MIIAGLYSFNRGREVVEKDYAAELAEVKSAISAVDSPLARIKVSNEKTMLGRSLFSPIALNKAFRQTFEEREWKKLRVFCEYSKEYYTDDYVVVNGVKGAYREMDFIKNRVGVEVQFGKYAFMVYNVCAKMTIFRNLGHIDVGIEIVPIKSFAKQMSSGVSYFEQFVWDLEQRGVSNIDIPVLIIGVAES